MTSARYRTHVCDERATQNMQHRTYNIYVRQARDAEHGTLMRRASDTEHATRTRGTRDRKSETCRRLRHVSLIRRLEVHILSNQVLRVLCSNVNYYMNYIDFWPRRDPEPPFQKFSKTRDFGNDGGRVGGMLFDNPPSLLLKISFMEEKNSDGPPNMEKQPCIFDCIFACIFVYPARSGSGTSGPLE